MRALSMSGRASRIPHLGQRVVGEVGGRRLRDAAGRAADAAVVAAQHGDARARQVVGDQPERLDAEHLLVAVLRTAARDEHHRRKRAGVAGTVSVPARTIAPFWIVTSSCR